MAEARFGDRTSTPTAIVRQALLGTGIDLVASCPVDAYDSRAPGPLRSAALLPGARGVVVAGSAGPTLWRQFILWMNQRTAASRPGDSPWDEAHPYDAFVAQTLCRADAALSAADIAFRRFEAAFDAPVRLDFVALAELVGLGSRGGPLSLLIHPEHGAFWALRGAWLVGGEVEPPQSCPNRCEGCSAPCVGGWPAPGEPLAPATAEARRRCIVRGSVTYDEDQIAYHYDRAGTVARLRAGAGNQAGTTST